MTLSKEKGLAGADLGADLGRGGDMYDDVDLFGLDEFGAPVGIGPLWGAMIGTGAGTLTAIGVRSLKPEWGGKSELIGLGAGLLAGGVMIAFPGTRHAGWVAMASAGLNNGLRAVEQYFSAPSPYNATAPVYHPLGEQRIERRQALGIAQVERRQALGGARGGAHLLGGPQFNRAAGHWGTSAVLMNQ